MNVYKKLSSKDFKEKIFSWCLVLIKINQRLPWAVKMGIFIFGILKELEQIISKNQKSKVMNTSILSWFQILILKANNYGLRIIKIKRVHFWKILILFNFFNNQINQNRKNCKIVLKITKLMKTLIKILL